MGQPFALDFGAVMTVGEKLGADLEMLADVLPDVERTIIGQLIEPDGGDHDEMGEGED